MNMHTAFPTVLRVQNTVFLTRNRKNRHYRVKNNPFHTRNGQTTKVAIVSGI